MKTFSALLLAVAASALVGVDAHGHMTSPTIRPITAKYRADALFGLKGAGDDELQLAPLENLSTRGQADQPASPTFDMMNGCRGINYEAGGPTTSVTPGQELPVKWMIQAPHPGYMELYIVKASKESSGKIMYKQDGAALKRIDNFATGGGEGSTTVTLPSSLSGCDTAGNCALQFYWHSDIAKQTYVSCADIVTSGSGASSGSTPAATPAPASSGDDEYDTPAPASGDDEYDTPSATTAKPAATTAKPAATTAKPSSGSVGSDATTAPSKACKKRMRRN